MNRPQLVGAVGALVAVSAMVGHSSTAAFTASTDNVGNSWTAGTVSLTNDAPATALFSQRGLVPGSTGSRCVVVTYGGNVPSAVRLYGAVTGGTGLGSYLHVTVARGSGAKRDCSDFSSKESLYSGTLAAFAGAHLGFGSGVGSWVPTGPAQSSTYRIAWSLEDDNAAQSRSVQATFTWEAQNT